MNPIEVWAPGASQVWLHVQNHQLKLRGVGSGWWSSVHLSDQLQSVRDSATGYLDYMVSVDNGPPRPDPRSQWQPQGFEGPSRLFDHENFSWKDSGFQAPPLASAIIYEVHIGTFTSEGTFASAIERLDDLISLGVTHVELMPVAEFPGEFGWGYDGVGLFAAYSVYGGPIELKRLVDACHQRGLAVILDVVYNHAGPVGNHLAEFGPYFTDRYHTPWGPAVNFDGPGGDEVRRFFIDNAVMWLRDFHFDGLRLDAVHAIVDSTAYPFLEQLADEVERLSAFTARHLVLIAESDLNDPRLLRSKEAGGYGLHAQWCDDFHHALHTVLTKEQLGYYVDFGSLQMLASALTQPYLYSGQLSPARGRRHGRPSALLSHQRFVTYAQNHDQIGNRARGERLGHLVGPRMAKIAAAIVLCGPYIPQLFQGEEWNSEAPFLYFADWRRVPELSHTVNKGRQEEFANFGWCKEDLFDPVDESTFNTCKLDWQVRADPEHADMLAWYKRLIQLRRSLPDLNDGRQEQLFAEADEQLETLLLRRGRVLLAVNVANAEREIVLPDETTWRYLLSSNALPFRESYSQYLIGQRHFGLSLAKMLGVLLRSSRCVPFRNA